MSKYQYGLAGVASDVQLGKKGGRFIYDKENALFKLTEVDGVTVSRVKIAEGVDLDDAVALSQLNDAVATIEGQIADAVTSLEGQIADLGEGIDVKIGDLDTLTTDAKGSLVDAINEVHSDISNQIGELGTMSTQDADAVAITGGAIEGVDLKVDAISEHTAGSGVTIEGTVMKDGDLTTGSLVVNGDLTVLGDTVSLEVTELRIEDNLIELNKGETGAGVTAGVSGIEVNRGTEDNVKMVWDEVKDTWSFRYVTSGDLAKIEADFDLGSQIVGRENGGFGVDISGYADDSLIFANGVELAKGQEHQVLTTTAEGVEYTFVEALRNAETGKVGVSVSEADSATGEYLEIRNETDKVFLTAKNESGTGDVDLYIQGQGNGDVIIAANASDQGLIVGEAGTSLTVGGGAGVDSDAGDLILKGGDGSGTFKSGDVILQGGTGGAQEGIVMIRDSAGNMVAKFTGGTENAVDYVDFVNGIGETEIKAEGDSTDVNLVLAPKGDGFVVAPAGYDITNAPAEAFVTKGSFDSAIGEVVNNVDPLIQRATFSANGTDNSFAIGTLNDVAGKLYFVSRVTIHVSTEVVGADEMVVSDGVATLASADESDVMVGTYLIDLPFAASTAGGSTFTLTFDSAPSAGQVTAVVEYKVVDA